MKKRVLSVLMAVIMVMSILPVSAMAAEYKDTDGHWAEEAIDRWSDYGVIQGNNGAFNPNGALTRAHMAAILCRLLDLPEAEPYGFADVKESDWFAPYINACAAAGIMLGNNGYANPNSPITRQQAIVMLARALHIDPVEDPDLSGYTDAGQVSVYAAGYLEAMADLGIVKGTSDTTLSPGANITRAATVTILHRAIDVYVNEDGAVVDAEDVDGIILVVSEDVEIKNAPEGTVVVIADNVGTVKINGQKVSDDQAYEVPAEAKKPTSSGGSSSGGYIHSHSYSGTITTPATCTTAGVKTYTCGGCGHSYTEVIPSSEGHIWTESSRVTEDCYNDEQINYTCSGCGATKSETGDAATGHSWVEYEPAGVPATCTATGTMTFNCINGCGETKTETLDMIPHDMVLQNDQTACGTKIYKCSYGCGTQETEITEEGCEFSAWESIDDAQHRRVCGKCGFAEVQTHTFGDWVVDDADETKHEHTCTACNHTPAPLDHTYGAMVLVDENTGKFTCTACDKYYTEDYVARIGGTYYTTLAGAITAAGSADVITLLENLTLTGDIFDGKTLTFNGQGEKTVVVSPGAAASGTLTFQNMNITGATYPGSTYSNFYTTQLNGAAKVTYSNCVITGLITTYSAVTEFVGCDIYTDDYYSIFVYTDDVTFTECDIYADDDRWVKVYGEGDAANTTTFTECNFKFIDGYTGTDSMKPAINVDGSYRAYTVNITDCTVPEGVALFGGTLNANDKIYVNGKLYLADGLYQDGNTYYVANANGLTYLSSKALTSNNSTAEGVTIELMNDIDMAGAANFSSIIAQRGDSLTFDGKGYTISNLAVVSGENDNTTGQAGMFYCYPNSTLNVSNLTLNGITVTADDDGSGYAAAVIGYCEGTAVLNNVDVVNATVTGAKSSGMLAGHLSGSLTATGCDVSGTVTLSNYEDGGHYAGEYIGTVAGNASLTTCTANVILGGNLKATNVGKIYGRIVGSSVLSVDGTSYVATAVALAAAVAAGATNLWLTDGEYDVDGCGGKTLTISGSEKAVLKLYNDGEDGCDYAFGGNGTSVGNITFNGVTIDTTSNTGNYKGFAYMKGTFNDCNFVGAYSLNNANDFAFNRCTFDFKDSYLWTWGANSVTFTECTFNGNSKAILAHGSASTVIKIDNCIFAATEKGYTYSADWTAAVEIDPVGTNTYTINFTGNNTKTDSYNGWTRVKDGSSGHTITEPQ